MNYRNELIREFSKRPASLKEFKRILDAKAVYDFNLGVETCKSSKTVPTPAVALTVKRESAYLEILSVTDAYRIASIAAGDNGVLIVTVTPVASTPIDRATV